MPAVARTCSKRLLGAFTAAADRETAPGVIERLCFSRLDYNTELKSTAATDKYKTSELPDGKRHHSWRQTSPVRGSIVQPGFIGTDASGFHDTFQVEHGVRR